MNNNTVFAVLSTPQLHKQSVVYNVLSKRANTDTPPQTQQEDQSKQDKAPGIGDKRQASPWDRWGGKAVGIGAGALGMYGVSKMLGFGGLLTTLAMLAGAGIGGYFGHNYWDAKGLAKSDQTQPPAADAAAEPQGAGGQ